MPEREQTLRVTRIIHLAITVCPALFLGVAFYLLHRGGGELGRSESGSLISFVSLGAALAALAMFVLIPRLLAAKPGDPYLSFRSVTVVRAAILEMPALLGCVAYILEGKNTPLGAGIALGMILILAGTMPTGPRLDAWISGSASPRDER